MTDSPAAAAPAASADPFAEVKARAAAAVEDARVELLDLSHRIHANPEPAFEEVQAAALGRGGDPRARLRRRAPGGQPRDRRPRPDHGRQGTGRAPDRGPRRVRRAPRPRPRLRPQHHGRVGGRGGDRARGGAGRVGRRGRVPRHSGGGAGERQGDHDPRRAVRGPRCRPPVPPLRPQPRRVRPARVGGRDRDLHGPPVACRIGPVEGQERPRRDDRPVRVRRAVAPAAADPLPRPRDHPGGRHGREHHPGPHARLVHDPQRRPGATTTRRCAAGSSSCARRPPPRRTSRSRSSSRAARAR